MVSPLPPSAAALRQSATRLGAQLAERMTPRQRQFALLGVIVAAGVGLLWLIFASTDTGSSSGARKPAAGAPGPVTNIGVMPPGQQVNPVDQWVGTAGSKLAQYESEREEQTRLNRDRQAFEARTMQRFAELEQRLRRRSTQASQAAAATALQRPGSCDRFRRSCLHRSHHAFAVGLGRSTYATDGRLPAGGQPAAALRPCVERPGTAGTTTGRAGMAAGLPMR
jgi:hypothetical protein